MNQNITLPELAQMLSKATGTTKNVCEIFLKELFATVSKALIDGKNVNIKGLGSFRLTNVGSRKSVSVNTGAEIEIPSHNKLTFVPDKAIAAVINAPFANFETIVLSDDVTDEMLQKIDFSEAAASRPDGPAAPPPFTKLLSDKPAEPKETSPEPPALPQEPAEEPEAPQPEPETSPAEPPELPQEAADDEKPAEAEQPAKEQPAEDEDDKDERVTALVPVGEEYYRELIKTETHKSMIKGFVWGALMALLLCTIIGYAFFSKSHSAGSPDKAATDTTLVAGTDSVNAPGKAEVEKQSVVLDTITAQMVLFRIARKHFGDEHFWVYIYKENEAKISNPNAVSPGTVVTIPPAKKYGIDANDPQSVERAKQLSFEILSKYE
ncbi:MAG: HU family DNA-binding protein [Muribaculaceae bacterium]|nr:HU family DNA-binding protein [Muribaculaceae bacterium]